MNFNLSENEIYKYRAKPFYYLTTDKEEELTYEKVYESLTELKECGFGGFVLFNKPPHGFNKDNYLTKHWFDMVKNFAKAAKELSLEMYINNGFDYPPGAVAGKVKEIAPDLHPLRIVLEDGKPQVKKVEWGFPAFEVEESAKIFTELVYESYKREVGEFFGDPIKGIFADTDNRRVNEHVMFVENHPMADYFPWAENFEESFKKEYDYDIMPFMPQILKRESIKEARDYWEHSGRMYSRWFKKNREWLNKNGLIMIGHAGDTPPYLYKDAPRASCFTEGRFLDVASGFDYAGTDHELLCLDGGITNGAILEKL